MREIAYDLRSNGLLRLLKVLIIGLVLIGLYNMHSLSENTDRAIAQSFTSQTESNLYVLADTLLDPSLFEDFRNSPDKLSTVGNFYDSLNCDDDLVFLSLFNQAIPIAQFRGGEEFGYTYGTEMQSANNFGDPLGRQVFAAKAMQINQHTCDFYGLRVEQGAQITWGEVDYSSGCIPVLLGSSYKGVYEIGDELAGWMYSKDARFKIIGFLEQSSSLHYKGEVNFYLDKYIVVPYPPSLAIDNFDDLEFYGILSIAMVNGDIAAPREMPSQEVLTRLDSIKSVTGYSEYTLLNAPTYLVQLTLMRQIMEDSFALIAAIQAALTLVAAAVLFFLDYSLCVRRKEKISAWVLLGEGASMITKRILGFWTTDYFLALILIITVYCFVPNQNFSSLLVTVGALVLIVFLDIVLQRRFLLLTMNSLGQKG